MSLCEGLALRDHSCTKITRMLESIARSFQMPSPLRIVILKESFFASFHSRISKIAVDTTRIITRSGSDSETLTFGIQDVIFAAVDDGSIIKVYSDTSMPSVHTGSVPEAIYPEVIEVCDNSITYLNYKGH